MTELTNGMYNTLKKLTGTSSLTLAIVFFMLVFPAMILFVSMGTWDTFVRMHIPDGDCWENAKHERVCKGTVTCKIGRNFCE